MISKVFLSSHCGLSLAPETRALQRQLVHEQRHASQRLTKPGFVLKAVASLSLPHHLADVNAENEDDSDEFSEGRRLSSVLADLCAGGGSEGSGMSRAGHVACPVRGPYRQSVAVAQVFHVSQRP